MNYDVVYWWQGGTVTGQWRKAIPYYKDIPALVREIEHMGYVAVPGKRSIGAPEGPPIRKAFVRIGMMPESPETTHA